jgi:glycosidase
VADHDYTRKWRSIRHRHKYLQGTPYIYQGEEIGMTDPHFTSIAQYRDVESINGLPAVNPALTSSLHCIGVLELSRDFCPKIANTSAPYIYQGEEIGMTDPHFTSIAQYRDVESINAYHQLLSEGHIQGLPAVNPALTSSLHCIGVLELSRDFCPKIANTCWIYSW